MTETRTSLSKRMSALAAELQKRFGEDGFQLTQDLNELTLSVPADRLIETALMLRDDEALDFEQLIDVCGIDYAAYGQTEWQTESAPDTGFGRGVVSSDLTAAEGERRFASVYHLLSVANNWRLRLKVYLDADNPLVPSMTEVWSSANWFEREAFDLYGILYEGHPDLRRILTDYGFIGHPFRKDFPLIGHVEMRYDAEQGRVVYEPVTSVEPRTLVPKVTRDDNRYLDESAAGQEQDNA